MKITDKELKSSTTKSTPFMVNKDEWDTKEAYEECNVCTAAWQKHLSG